MQRMFQAAQLVHGDDVPVADLPNNLTVANIRNGNSNIRNPILTSFATTLLPYRGLGTGLVRTVRAYPSTLRTIETAICFVQ